MEEELRNPLGNQEAEQIMAPAKKLYMFADCQGNRETHPTRSGAFVIAWMVVIHPER